MKDNTNKLDKYLMEVINSFSGSSPVSFSGDPGCILNRWLVKSELVDNTMQGSLEPHLSMDTKILKQDELGRLPEEMLEYNWRTYISDDTKTFYHHNTPENLFSLSGSKEKERYVYSLCNVYSSKSQDAFVYLITSPTATLKVWVNGELAFAGSLHYFTRNYIFIAKLRKGSNTILVERVVFSNNRILALSPKYFLVSVRPCKGLIEKQPPFAFLDPELPEYIKYSYLLVPDRAFFPEGGNISFVVLPRYFENTGNERVRISIYNALEEIVQVADVMTAEKISLALGSDIRGVIRIKAESADNKDIFSEIYVFVGDMYNHIEFLIGKAMLRKDCNMDIIQNIRRLTEIPNVRTGMMKGSSLLMFVSMYYSVFKMFAEFERYLASKDSPVVKDMFEIFDRYAMAFKSSDIDGGFTAYDIYLPDGYDKEKKYPLLVYVSHGDFLSRYPLRPYRMFIERGNANDNAIVISIAGRIIYNKDYINETNIIGIIGDTVEKYNVDRDRIYLMGICTGSMRGGMLAARMPDLFAALLAFNGTLMPNIEEFGSEFFNNYGNASIYQLNSVDDNFFNGPAILNCLNQFDKVKEYMYWGFGHEEIEDYVNNKLLFNEIMRETKEKYPKNVHFTVFEPIYNKSFWLKAEYIIDLGSKAILKASMLNRNTIHVEAENIGCFSLLLNSLAMELDNDIQIIINNFETTIQVGKYSKVYIRIKEDGLFADTWEIPEEEFKRQYEYIGVDEKVMGIKQVYLHKCTILDNTKSKNSNNIDLEKNLLLKLKQPMKMRARDYVYDLLAESNISLQGLEGSNFVCLIDSRDISLLGKQVLELVEVKVGEEGIEYQGTGYEGEYFALVKCNNPMNTERQLLLVIYNSDAMLAELTNFIDTFEYNLLFYSDTVVYNKGKFYPIRNYCLETNLGQQ